MPKDPSKPLTRADQPYTAGLGQVFTTPKKRRDKKKSTTFVAPIRFDILQKHLLEQIQRLKGRPNVEPTIQVHDCSPVQADMEVEASEEVVLEVVEDDDGSPAWVDEDTTSTPRRRRIVPDATAHELYARWMAALPHLVPCLISYTTRTIGVPLEPITDIQCSCQNFEKCVRKSTSILCLFIDRKFLTILLHTIMY
jgi:hypothetical protein